MTISEILKAKGIADETVQAVIEDMKTNKVYTSSEENLDVRYGKLKQEHDGKLQELTEAQGLIAELKKSTKGQEESQNKIAAYENQLKELQRELERTKLESAIKVELLSAKAADVDYLTYKLNEKLKADGEALTLDESGGIKGWQDKLNGLKTQYPKMFDSDGAGKDGYKVLDQNKLPNDDNKPAFTKSEILKKPYAERAKLYEDNPEQYNEIMKG